jgi:hypothetical protein
MSVADDSLSLVSEGFESQDNSLSVRPSDPSEQIGTGRSTLPHRLQPNIHVRLDRPSGAT